MNAVDSFLQHLVPTVSDDPQVISGALIALLDKIGPAVVVTHSQSGLFGWLAGARSPHVKGIIAYGTGVRVRARLGAGADPALQGNAVRGEGGDSRGVANLAKIPIQVVYGDNIQTPIPDLVADGRRAQVITSKMFVEALNNKGGSAAVLHLPEAGLYGNSHFMFSDLNNIEVADQLSAFLQRQGLDAR